MTSSAPSVGTKLTDKIDLKIKASKKILDSMSVISAIKGNGSCADRRLYQLYTELRDDARDLSEQADNIS